MIFLTRIDRWLAGLAGIATVALTAPAAIAEHDGHEHLPNIEGVELKTRVKAEDGQPFDELISGFEFRTKDTQALQLDDFTNPAFVWVEQGEELWDAVEGTAGKSCSSCHGAAEEGMKGVRAQFPKWHDGKKRPLTLEQQVNLCRTEQMGAEAYKWESDQMLGLTAFIGLQSRGGPIAVDYDAGDMKSWWDRGKELYYKRVGQLDIACANCHEGYPGKYIRADRLSQGQSNGFPTYRLKWQKIGTLHRRFKGCMEQVRAKPYKRGSDEFVALEVYLAWRGMGLSVETPAVRQ